MSECPICALVQSKTLTLFEDEDIVAMAAPEPSVPGHLIVVPKIHSPIFESVPDNVVKRLFSVANRISIAAFEAIGAQGTNLLVQNGLPAGQSKPHFLVNIIPRREGDNLSLEWQPGKVSEEDSQRAETLLKEASQGLGKPPKEKPKPLEEKKPEKIEMSESDYRFRSLRRIP